MAPVTADTQGVGVESPSTTMTSGPPPPLFGTPANVSNLDPDADMAAPGTFPFTRGVQPSMSRARPWSMRQYAEFADAAESTRRYWYLPPQGVRGLILSFDLPN